MIIDFSFRNFRSFKDSTEFTMRSESNKDKIDNTFVVSSAATTELRLLKTSVIYGANASGKSNFIRAFHAFVWLIKNSSDFKVDSKKIACYEPYELDTTTEHEPISFKITFLIEEIKYVYEVMFDKDKILKEKLDSYPNRQISNLFERNNNPDSDSDIIKLGKDLKDKKIVKKVFNKQLYLSRFGSDIPHDQLTKIYKYLVSISVWNAFDKFNIDKLSKEIAEVVSNPENVEFKNRLSKLLKISDTRIERIESKELKKEEFDFPREIGEEIFNTFYESNKIKTFSYHKVYKNREEIGYKEFDFNKKESTGTKVLFALGGIILQTLEKGGVIIFDELDNSLHPKLCKFLIRLFNSKISNPKNAQLVFATHEVTLLDKDVFRKDQIWFAQKNKYGESEIYCVKDFEGVRDSTNFELWYRTGKFGGNPKIKEVEFIYE